MKHYADVVTHSCIQTALMEKKCLWLEFDEMKNELEALKAEKKRCKDDMDVRVLLVFVIQPSGRENV